MNYEGGGDGENNSDDDYLPLGPEYEWYEKATDPKITYLNGVYGATPTEMQKFKLAAVQINVIKKELPLFES